MIGLILSILVFLPIHLVRAQTSDKVLCESSDGQWNNEKCTCPEISVGFKEGFGCDYKSEAINVHSSEMKFLSIGLLILGVILIILFIILIKFMKRKNDKRKI